MNEELARVIESVSKDKGIEKEIILEAVNESVVSAAHKLLKTDPRYKDLECQFNEYNDIELFEFKKVVDDLFDDDMEISIEEARKLDPEIEIGEEIGIKLDPSYTRIAIQNARQKIIQKLKEAEAKVIYETLQDSLASKGDNSPKNLSEAVSKNNRLVLKSNKKETQVSDSATERMKRLAVII